MMRTQEWRFSQNAGWQALEKHDWRLDDSQDWDVSMKALGFLQDTSHGRETLLGDEYSPGGMIVWRTEAPEGDEFCIWVITTSEIFTAVWLPDVPSFLEFLRRYGVLAEVALLREVLDDMHEITKRFFHANHGHGTDHVCNECDPTETKRRAARDREVKASRAVRLAEKK